jgi:exopolyphosphatase/guanosine-5'-triphosphate,3'-diphosphate pyrophosphatase
MSRYGAVDIGSNSIRMQVAEASPGGPHHILAEDRQVTRLGEGVFRGGELTPEAAAVVFRFLNRTAAEFQKQQVAVVRAVATAAVRDSYNRDEFLERASEALGARVEVISGQEEARLIHLGVQSCWPHPRQTILIVDIGGGSAELILSRNGKITGAYSQKIGAVRLTEVFLKHDPPTELELRQLEEYVEEKLAPIRRQVEEQRPKRTIATSATAAAAACAIHRVPRAQRDLADRLRIPCAALRALYADLASKNLDQRRQVQGIGPRRAEVIVPGCGVLTRVLEDFQLPSLYYSRSGVRDGIIADLVLRGAGREEAHLDGDQLRSVREMARRYRVSLKHGDYVARLARHLFAGLGPCHQLPPSDGKLLEAAAYLHDVGHFISDTRHHRHSYYVVSSSDLPAFTDRERLVIAHLCRYHRKSLPGPQHSSYKQLSSAERKSVRHLTPLLRLADSLDRTHQQRVRSVEPNVGPDGVVLYLESTENTDLEVWAAQQVSGAFRQTFGRTLTLLPKNRQNL